MPGLAAVTTPALRASLGAPPGRGEDARLHGALEPSVREVWLVCSFYQRPFLGFSENGKVKNRFLLEKKIQL